MLAFRSSAPTPRIRFLDASYQLHLPVPTLLDPIVVSRAGLPVCPGSAGFEFEFSKLHGNECRARPSVVGLLGQHVPDQRRHFAGCCQRRNSTATFGLDAAKEGAQRPRVFEADHASSTRMWRAIELSHSVVRRCVAGLLPDWRTFGVSPRWLASFAGLRSRSISPIAARTEVAMIELIPPIVIRRRARGSLRARPARR